MNINLQGVINPLFGSRTAYARNGLKSTGEKLERQAKRDEQVAFFENQKENLKNVKCMGVEEIAAKLDKLHSYEDQIAGIKAAYNNEQMWHILDEAREMGEKIAEAAEKSEPKTPEERAEEMVEEALGIEGGGMLEEMLEETTQMQEELQEEMEAVEQMKEQQDVQEQTAEEMLEDSLPLEKRIIIEQLDQ